ncbi:MAG TPA: thioredoxin fold domain-containing protein [Thermoanaerobaculia bacterium]|nr:thioredoxin fold domain-containing protein [Thermoanaerobaculia bacterium]
MDCPKCGFSIPGAGAPDCPACGVVLAKASPPFTGRRPSPQVRPATPPHGSGAVSWPKLIKICLVLAVAFVGWRYMTSPAAGTSSWHQDAEGFDQAVAEQKTTGNPILLYFYTDWCGFCRRLENDVFASSRFGRRYASMIKVKVNPEHGGDERALAARYRIRGYPTVFLVRSGKRSDPIAGYGNADGFYARLDAAVP